MKTLQSQMGSKFEFWWSDSGSCAHYPERTTSIYLCNSAFISKVLDLAKPFPRKVQFPMTLATTLRENAEIIRSKCYQNTRKNSSPIFAMLTSHVDEVL